MGARLNVLCLTCVSINLHLFRIFTLLDNPPIPLFLLAGWRRAPCHPLRGELGRPEKSIRWKIIYFEMHQRHCMDWIMPGEFFSRSSLLLMTAEMFGCCWVTRRICQRVSFMLDKFSSNTFWAMSMSRSSGKTKFSRDLLYVCGVCWATGLERVGVSSSLEPVIPLWKKRNVHWLSCFWLECPQKSVALLRLYL